jgi:hypothetical protein
MLHESVHCVVTSCENRVTWRRILHLTTDDAPREPGADDAETEGLIADVSIYLCDHHHEAIAHLDDAEPFPPQPAEDAVSEDEAES